MNLLKSLQFLLSGKKKRQAQPIVSSTKWHRLHIDELERRDLPSLTPSGLITGAGGFDMPNFTWTAVAGTNHYVLDVIDNNTGQEPISVANINGSATSYQATVAQALTPGHSFTTELYAFNASNHYSLSTQRFTLAALAAPASPSPGATIPASSGYDTPTFTWGNVAGANHYYLRVVDNNTGQTRIVIPNVSGTSYTPTTALTPGHSFTTYVYAFSTNSHAYSLSTQKFTLTALAAPSQSGPSGTIPANSSYDTPTFTWSSVSGANHYDLRLVDSTTNALVINNPNVSTNSFTPTAPLTPGHSYTWYVAAVSANGQNSPAFSSETFNLAALAAPKQSGPSGTISTTSPSFTWNNVTGANHYYLRVIDSATNAAVINNPNVTTNSFTPTTPLTSGHAYTWYVAAVSRNGKNTLAFSSQTFTLATSTLAAPSMTSGPSGTVSTTSPSFAWNNVSGANHYYLRLVDTTTNVVVVNNSNVSTNSFTLTTPLTPGNSYTWSVAAMSSNGRSNFSSQTFNLAALASPSMPSSLSGTIAPSSGYETPTFTWGTVAWASYYRLYIVDNTTGALAIYVTNVSGTSYTATATQALMAGHGFTTYVYAFTTNNQAYSLSKQTFALAALQAPTNLTPSGTIPVSSGYEIPTFTWSPVVGANHYYLKVVDNNTGSTRIVVPNVNGTSYTTTAAQALTPGHSYTTYVYAFGTNSHAYSLGTQTFTLGAAPVGLTVSPTTLSSAMTYSTYGANLTASGGSGTYTFAVTSGSLPTGLTLNTNSGLLCGIPTAAGSDTFTVTATDSNNTNLTGNRSCTLQVQQNTVISPTLSVNAPTSGLQGQTLNFTTSATDSNPLVTAAGFIYSWNFGDGTTIGGATVSHTYSNQGTFNVSVTVTAADGGTASWSGSISIAYSDAPVEPLLYQSDVQYVGAFRVPNYYNSNGGMSYGGDALAYNAANNSLFIVGFGNYDAQPISEISIPSTIVNSSNLNNLTTDTILQPWTNFVQNLPNKLSGDSDGALISGLMVYNGELIGTQYAYYSGAYTQVLSHFVVNSLDLSTASVQGLYQVGSGGRIMAGYMTPIPSEWQASLGGFTALTGLSDAPIMSTVSSGPAAIGFNPGDLGSANDPASTYLAYTGGSLLGAYSGPANPMQSGTTAITGDAFVPGTSSILFFGATGTNYEGYGDSGPWGSTGGPDAGKGPQSLNGQYSFQVWAYNANDFVAVQNGESQPAQVMPYDVWNFSLPISAHYQVGGVAFDSSSGRIYVSLMNADRQAAYSSLPLIEVFQVTVPSGGPVAAPPQIGTLVGTPSITPNPNYPSYDGAEVPQWVGTYAGPVNSGDPVVLTAGNVYAITSGASVTQVAFYLSPNNSDPFSSTNDTLLGYGTGTENLPNGGSTNWALTIPTTELASGTYTIFAQAEDSNGLLSDPISMTLTIA